MALYYLTLTSHGAAALAAAQAGQPFAFAELVLGDANGQPYLPDSAVSRTALVHECAAVPVQSVTVVGDQVHVQTVIPASVGGFAIHELGLTDATGQLLYIGNWHGGYKPALTEGAAGELELTLILDTSGLPQVVIELDPTSVLATRQWALDHFVLQTVYDTHVEQNALDHDNLLALIDAETAARSAAVQDLTTQLTNEATLRGQADAMEQQARIAGDQHLQDQIDALTVATTLHIIDVPDTLTTAPTWDATLELYTTTFTGRQIANLQFMLSCSWMYIGGAAETGITYDATITIELHDGSSSTTRSVPVIASLQHQPDDTYTPIPSNTMLQYVKSLDPQKTYTLTLRIAGDRLGGVTHAINGYTQ